jgi:hypothetical protein
MLGMQERKDGHSSAGFSVTQIQQLWCDCSHLHPLHDVFAFEWVRAFGSVLEAHDETKVEP